MNTITNELKICFLIYLDKCDLINISKVDIKFNNLTKRWKCTLDKEIQKRIVPLNFWFNTNPTLVLPSIAMPYNLHFVWFELEKETPDHTKDKLLLEYI